MLVARASLKGIYNQYHVHTAVNLSIRMMSANQGEGGIFIYYNPLTKAFNICTSVGLQTFVPFPSLECPPTPTPRPTPKERLLDLKRLLRASGPTLSLALKEKEASPLRRSPRLQQRRVSTDSQSVSVSSPLNEQEGASSSSVDTQAPSR